MALGNVTVVPGFTTVTWPPGAVTVVVAPGNVTVAPGLSTVTWPPGAVTVTVAVATETRGLPVTVVVAVAVGTALGVVVARDVSGASTATIVSCGEFPPRCVSRGTATAAPATKVATNAVVIQARRSGREVTRGVSGRRANVPAKRVDPGPSDRRTRVNREGGT
ncbi:hypothetical protein GCM10009741_44910 [Kribbella lupini]|uniref:Uncharacterized protein n=1 Tax=Kribbella lupini TaxID=291602 RepID=A0ABN2BEE7_9ACTN